MENQIIELITKPDYIKNKTIKIYFNELYNNIKERIKTNTKYNNYLFYEIFNYPLFICLKLFKSINTSNDKNLSIKDFTEGLFNLFYMDQENFLDLLFKILNFNHNNDFIRKDDVILFFLHFSSIKYNYHYEDNLIKIIDNFFEKKEEINLNQFKEISNYRNSDLLVLFRYFLNLKRFFTYEQLKYFQNIIKNKSIYYEFKEDSDNRKIFINFNNITQNLIDYINIKEETEIYLDEEEEEIIIQNKNSFYSNNLHKMVLNNIEENVEEEELNELQNFEDDVHNVLNYMDNEPINYNKDNFSNKKRKCDNNNNEIDKSNNDNNNIFKDEYFDLRVKSNDDDDSYNQIKNFFISRSSTKVRSVSCNENITNNKIKKLMEDEEEDNFSNDNKNVFYLFYYSKNKLFPVKMVLMSNLIFMFTKDSIHKKLTFSKLLFLNNIYININDMFQYNNTNYYIIHFISTFQNYFYSIKFYSEDLTLLKTLQNTIYTENNIEKIEDKYSFDYDKILGKGKYGECIQCSLKENRKNYCVKIINKKNFTFEEYKTFLWEKNVFLFIKKFPFKNLVKCYEVYENEEKIYLIFEELIGNDLKNVYKILKFYPEKIRFKILYNISSQIFETLNFLNKYGIIHRDIKHTNIICNSKYKITLIDFGLSRIMGHNEFANNPYGSLTFKAPEIILNKLYNFKVDVWSTGILIYYLIYGKTPFSDEKGEVVKKKIINYNLNLESNNSHFIFRNYLINIINDCLIKNYQKRLDCKEISNKYFSENLENFI